MIHDRVAGKARQIPRHPARRSRGAAVELYRCEVTLHRDEDKQMNLLSAVTAKVNVHVVISVCYSYDNEHLPRNTRLVSNS